MDEQEARERAMVNYYHSYADSVADSHPLHVSGQLDHDATARAVVAYAEAFCGLWTQSPVDTAIMDLAFTAANLVAHYGLPVTAEEAQEQDAVIDHVLARQGTPFNWFNS